MRANALEMFAGAVLYKMLPRTCPVTIHWPLWTLWALLVSCLLIPCLSETKLPELSLRHASFSRQDFFRNSPSEGLLLNSRKAV